VIYVVVSSVDGVIYPAFLRLTGVVTGKQFFIPGSGLLLFAVIAYLTGIFATNFLGKRMLRLGEAFLARIPFIKSIYSSVKDMTDAFSSQTKRAFKEVVLVEFPFKGRHAIGFVTKRSSSHAEETVCSVFIPTTPNPTSGFLLIIPEGELTFLQMTVDEALKYTISLGTSRIEIK
jgi:uncharacterized membrane protein